MVGGSSNDVGVVLRVSAVQVFHRFIDVELRMKNQLLCAVKAGLARESRTHGAAQRTRRHISWIVLKSGMCMAREWRERGQVLHG